MTQAYATDQLPAGPSRCIWAVLSHRSGENTQILALARELAVRSGWSLEIKSLAYRPAGLYNLLRPVGVHGIRSSARAELQPPWPDVIVSASVSNEPPCRWVRRQSGGRTRLVFLGRSWMRSEDLDLLVATPQYRVPDLPAVLQNQLTLHDWSPLRLKQAALKWEAEFANYPGPRIGVLLGGSAGPYVLGANAIQQLANYLNDRSDGSVLISTSSRTPPDLGARLAEKLRRPAFVYSWRAGDKTNPYPGILALADELIVSGDSIAMLSEAVATKKPVSILDLGAGAWSMGSRAGRAGSTEDIDLKARCYRLMMRYGHRRWTRDVTLVHQSMIASGQAGWLGETVPVGSTLAGADMDAAIDRIIKLCASQDSVRGAAEGVTSAKRPSTTR
ncbi:MAG: ELM1/GtrOC1 family putative glycosyltransferase [Gammaproteobacteria bacterium]